MNHFIAMNPQRGGNKGSASCLPLAEYDKLIAQPWLHDMVEQIRGGNDKLKGLMPFRCGHYSRFLKNHRSQKDADPTSFLFQTTIDIDDKELVGIAIEMARQLNCSDSIWKGMLLHLEYSARKKLHIDIRMPIGMTIEETQRAYCEALGVPCDESCFTPERIIFITDKDSEIYRSPHWYEVLPEEEIQARREAYLKRGLTIDGRGKAKPGNFKLTQISQISQILHSDDHLAGGNMGADYADGQTHKASDAPCSQLASSSSQPASSSSSQPASEGENLRHPNLDRDSKSASSEKGMDAHRVQGKSASSAKSACVNTTNDNQPSEKSLIAFDLFTEQAGLKNVNIDTEGSRHSSLLAIMSAGASRVMSEEELRRVVSVKMPSFSQERDCQQLIHDFYAKYADNTKPFSRDVIRINAQAEKQSQLGVRSLESFKLGVRSLELGVNSGDGAVSQQLLTPNSSLLTEEVPPEMPKKLPRLVDLLISQTPDIYKPAVAHAIFPPLATHLWRTSFRYIDNVAHEATLMCCLLAGTGAGKNCVQMPINMIMEDIRRRDRENLQREKEWKDEVTRKGANKDKRKRPQNLIIQEIDADMTNPAFVMRTAEAQEHFLYTSLNEIDQFDALKGTGAQQFRIMCLAFDPGNQYGQTRVGTQSVTERVTIRFNWNASTTIQKGKRYFSRVLTDGPLSRINFCTIPEREIGAEMPVYGDYDDKFREQLRPYIERLCQASGVVDCPEAFRLAGQLMEENADFARLSQSRIYENLSFRANVIAYLKACVLYVANGYEWEPEMDDFIRWSEQYDLWCKMQFFGEAIAKADEVGEKSSMRGPQNLLQLLPDEFTLQQAQQLRLAHGFSIEGTKNMLYTWTHRKYIQRKKSDTYSSDSFIKLQYKNNQ